MRFIKAFLSLSLFCSLTAAAEDAQLARGKAAIKGLTGCYLVDYSYTETESLKAGYERDKRVYDVNGNKSVKEWIYADEIGENRVRLQHILFSTKLDGSLLSGSFLKHTGEDWEYNSSFLYDFTSPNHWAVKSLNSGMWTRRITNLDDGLRYQCAAAWSLNTAYPEWSCSSYAPIPGRETRDMGRHDYQTLDRSTRVIAYSNNWLERQENTKIIHTSEEKTPLAKEQGKIWYVRLPDSECSAAKDFAEGLNPFWQVLRETWDQVLVGDRSFVEKSSGGTSRYEKILYLEDEYAGQDLNNPEIRQAAKDAILNVIGEYRAN